MPKSFCLTCGTPYEYVGQKPNFSSQCGHPQTAVASQSLLPPQYAPIPQHPQYQQVMPPQYPSYGYQPQPQYGYGYQESIPKEAIEIQIAPRHDDVVDLSQVIGSGPSNLGGPAKRQGINKTDFKKLQKQMAPGAGKSNPIEIGG